MTLATLVRVAEKKRGSQKAVLAALCVSRQRLHSAMRGGPPLHAVRLVRLALASEVDPLDALRAGGRGEFADLLEQGSLSISGLKAPERSVLRTYRLLPRRDQRALRRWMAAIADAEVNPCEPGSMRKLPRERPGAALPASCRRRTDYL